MVLLCDCIELGTLGQGMGGLALPTLFAPISGSLGELSAMLRPLSAHEYPGFFINSMVMGSECLKERSHRDRPTVCKHKSSLCLPHVPSVLLVISHVAEPRVSVGGAHLGV